jgi:hypothetical protein
MGEVERAQALLQAAGVSGVKVQEQAEMVTMTKAEADSLRAGAPAQLVAPATPEIPSAPVPAAAVAAATPAPGQLPEGLMSVAEVEEHERNPDPKGLSYTQRMELGERYIKSAEHHMGEGTI